MNTDSLISGDDLDTFIGYEKDINALVDKLMADPKIGNVNLERRDSVVSMLSVLATQMLGRAGVLAMEILEEKNPGETSRELLAQAFSSLTLDLVMRLRSSYHIYADEGFLPTAAVAKERVAELNTKH